MNIKRQRYLWAKADAYLVPYIKSHIMELLGEAIDEVHLVTLGKDNRIILSADAPGIQPYFLIRVAPRFYLISENGWGHVSWLGGDLRADWPTKELELYLRNPKACTRQGLTTADRDYIITQIRNWMK